MQTPHITKEWLKEQNACQQGYNWFLKQDLTDSIQVLNSLIKEDRHNWANWTIVRLMTRPQYLKYAIFAAEQVIGIYEKKYPDNKAPREAIEACKLVLESDTFENRSIAAVKRKAADAAYAYADAAADADAYAADAAAYAAADAAAYADAAYAAADAAAYAAVAAAYAAADAAAYAAADAAADAAYAYADAAYAYADAAYAARKLMISKILKYGIKILKSGE